MPSKPKSELKDTAVFALVDRTMKARLEALARERHVPIAHLLREALRQYLKNPDEAAA